MTLVELPPYTAELPDTAYNMWVRGELHDFLHLPNDGTRVEIIGGEIAVSPAPTVRHAIIVQDISNALTRAHHENPEFPWRLLQVTQLTPVGPDGGYIPDLVVLDAAMLKDADDADVPGFVPDQIEMAVEVTSPSRADDDRKPTEQRDPAKKPSKWTGYARAEIPYCLLVDRDPERSAITLFSIPDQASAAYLHVEGWQFGEKVHLPDPFNVDIDTSGWKPWKK
ncbi:Uma2 family endonuclease [Actinomadura sp. 6N118]|uniref:Uma2 family endonuclease n=1 Tax=Actinomadura sp. 6N118 TaxID=3375151 RepID=UPI0037A318DE